MNSVANDIALYLRDVHGFLVGTAVDSDWPVFAGQEPTKPDECITLISSGGPDLAYTFNKTDPNTDYSTFQMRIRGRNSLSVNNQMETLQGLLSQTSHWYVFSNAAQVATPPAATGLVTHYMDVLISGSPFDLPVDDNNRFIKVLSFRVLREDREY